MKEQRYALTIAEHSLSAVTSVSWAAEWITSCFPAAPEESSAPESGAFGLFRYPPLSVEIREGAAPFDGKTNVTAGSAPGGLTLFERTDYRITVDSAYTHAVLEVYDTHALKHALMHLYSLYIIHLGWGLLLHSSCAIDHGRAYLFAGDSGSGKSTAAILSSPRPLLSDAASIVKITPRGVKIFDSPFRSELRSDRHPGSYPLASIYLLNPSEETSTRPLPGQDALVHVMDQAFYWPYDPAETLKVTKLAKMLAAQVPCHELHFQNNDRFWERIS